MTTNKLPNKLNAYGNFILALAALVTAFASFNREPDPAPAKKTFEWASERLEELSGNDIRAQREREEIREYLEKYADMQDAVYDELLERLESKRPRRPRIRPAVPDTAPEAGSTPKHAALDELLEDRPEAPRPAPPPPSKGELKTFKKQDQDFEKMQQTAN